MKLISQLYVGTSPVTIGPCRSVKVQSLTGTLHATFDGEEVLLQEGDVVELPVGLLFATVRFRGENGTEAIVLYGMASFSAAGVGGGTATGNLLTGTSAAPLADGIYPADKTAFALYYDTNNQVLYYWNAATQQWD